MKGMMFYSFKEYFSILFRQFVHIHNFHFQLKDDDVDISKYVTIQALTEEQ